MEAIRIAASDTDFYKKVAKSTTFLAILFLTLFILSILWIAREFKKQRDICEAKLP